MLVDMSEEPDRDLEALPPPRRPWRKLTLSVMALTLLGSVGLGLSLRGELGFSLKGGAPRPVGELSALKLQGSDENAWIQGEAELEAEGAIAYRRPLESDSYRLSRVRGANQLWV